MKSKNNCEFEAEEKIPNTISIYVKEGKRSNTYNIYLSCTISTSNISEILQFMNVLRSTTKNDNIKIYINCTGGDIVLAGQMLNAMEDCKGQITTIADGEVISAGTLIFLAGHKKEVKNNSSLMFHDFKLSLEGSLRTTVSHLTFNEKYLKDFFIRCTNKFLTSEELKKVFDGEEVWFTAQETRERLNLV